MPHSVLTKDRLYVIIYDKKCGSPIWKVRYMCLFIPHAYWDKCVTKRTFHVGCPRFALTTLKELKGVAYGTREQVWR